MLISSGTWGAKQNKTGKLFQENIQKLSANYFHLLFLEREHILQTKSFKPYKSDQICIKVIFAFTEKQIL